MAADALTPCVARPWGGMILAMWNRQVLLFHEEKSPLPLSCQIKEIIYIVNTFFFMFSIAKRVNTHAYTLNFEEIVEHKNK